MSNPETPTPRPDPWAVVEHHAQQSADRRAGSMSSAQRLTLYASSAPEVIGAVRVQPGEFGLTRAGRDDQWWKVSVPGRTPGTPLWMAWNSAGKAILQRPATTLARAIMGGGLTFMLGMITFTRMLGPRALLPAVVLAVGIAVLTKQLFPAWSSLGTKPDDDKYVAMLEELVDKYEGSVPRG